ncbi:MAG TPA: DUF302 domain-containing protein [Gammaproteobacteria bacterium]
MKNLLPAVFLFICVVFAMPAMADDDYISKPSAHSVSVTIDRLENALKAKGITVFARVDHAAGAASVGEQLADSQLLIFGNPKLGTPLMQEKALVGLDLPMKALAWKDARGQVWLSYLKPSELQNRHDLMNSGVIAKMTGALDGLTSKAAGKD